MAENRSPDGTYPTMPLVLAVDGELLTNDKLCTSATVGLGWLGKLIDAVGYLKARSPQLFGISTDGVGGITTLRRTPGDDGTTAFFSSIAVATTSITCTFTTALASDRDCLAFVSNQSTAPGDQRPYIYAVTTTAVVIRVWDVSLPGDIDLAANSCEFGLCVFPNLAGYT